jgi:hypothetical protein
MLKISDELASYVIDLFPEETKENRIKRLIENELRRRLARYHLTVRNLEAKYQMDFNSFKTNRMVEQQGYSFEVENDFCEWEMAIDGIATSERKLKKLQESSHEH